MNRMHIHLSVESLEKSVAFYSKLFGTEPSVLKADYAKWMLEDPRVNFAMSSNPGTKRGIEHIGIQSENAEELAGVYGRIKDAGGAIFDEGATTCCYAQSEKSWAEDPQGVRWEIFHTHGESQEWGTEQPADSLSQVRCCG